MKITATKIKRELNENHNYIFDEDDIAATVLIKDVLKIVGDILWQHKNIKIKYEQNSRI